jgi:hypothetical protein
MRQGPLHFAHDVGDGEAGRIDGKRERGLQDGTSAALVEIDAPTLAALRVPG